MERQLASAGSDARELMGARQLQIIDVHDADSAGHHNKAFGRVFLTEGKSLTFYAFDLDQDQSGNSKRSFQVWASSTTGKDSIHSLGQLHADNKAPGRWVLKVENAELLKEINSVFVTSTTTTGTKQPIGQKTLYAYIGEANHP
jgi:hypothetical protein